MKIRLNQTSAGPDGNLPAGTVVTVDEVTGKYMIDSRQGVEVKESFPEPPATKTDAATFETATAPEGETATTPNRRKPREQIKEG